MKTLVDGTLDLVRDSLLDFSRVPEETRGEMRAAMWAAHEQTKHLVGGTRSAVYAAASRRRGAAAPTPPGRGAPAGSRGTPRSSARRWPDAERDAEWAAATHTAMLVIEENVRDGFVQSGTITGRTSSSAPNITKRGR